MKKKTTWVDTHCHLDMLDQPPAEVIAKAQEADVGLMITIGTKDESNRQVSALSRAHDPVYGAVGIHPHEAQQATDEHLAYIRSELKTNEKLVAIGECGFDFFYHHSDAVSQKRIFYSQVEMALELDYPLVIHARDAEAEVRNFFQDFKGQNLRGVFHSYTSGVALAEEILALGFYISFNGISTFPKGENVREVLKITPQDKLLLETDSPFLAPKPHRGRTNYPGYTGLVGEYVGNFLGIELEQLQQQCWVNAHNLFDRI